MKYTTRSNVNLTLSSVIHCRMRVASGELETQAPSTGLRHPCPKEEGAGERGVECVCLRRSVWTMNLYIGPWSEH